MLYLNKEHIEKIGIKWNEIISTIRDSVIALNANDFSQPIKPYLRYKNLTNRIIAMPAYIGGNHPLAGIKWIASFPENINKGIQRAHSVTILNESETGIPICILNTNLVSGIRTAAVSGVVLQEYINNLVPQKSDFIVGITGMGPIGQLHLNLILKLLDSKIKCINIYDLRPIDMNLFPEEYKNKINLVDRWEKAYKDADIFITCTVSSKAYINLPPKKGSLQLNVSLRDYYPEIMDHINIMTVDDWEEVCRENTDIEVMHKSKGLKEENTYSIKNIICDKVFENAKKGDTIMFNPMGMGIFDVAVGGYYYRQALAEETGVHL